MLKKIILVSTLAIVPYTTIYAQRGMDKGTERPPVIQLPRQAPPPPQDYRRRPPVISVRPRIILPQPLVMYSPAWCYEYYDYYPCTPHIYRPIPHRTVVVILGNNNPVYEIVDTIYVKDSTMKDTIKVIKHK